MISPITHADMCIRAERWLKNMGCGVVFRDPFRAITYNGEQPDAIGFKSSTSLLVEVKISRSDFFADRKKHFRKNPDSGMGDWRFYMCPPGVIKVTDLPEGWGLLYCHGNKIEKVHGIPTNIQLGWTPPFIAYKEGEMQMMYSALRRMDIRGHLPEIYEGHPEDKK